MLHGHINVQITKVSLCLLCRSIYKVKKDYRQKHLRSSEKNACWVKCCMRLHLRTERNGPKLVSRKSGLLGEQQKDNLFLLIACVHNLMPRRLKGVRFTFMAQNAHVCRTWGFFMALLDCNPPNAKTWCGQTESMGRIQKITPFPLAPVNLWAISSMWGSGSCSQPLPHLSFSFSHSVNLSVFLPSV